VVASLDYVATASDEVFEAASSDRAGSLKKSRVFSIILGKQPCNRSRAGKNSSCKMLLAPATHCVSFTASRGSDGAYT